MITDSDRTPAYLPMDRCRECGVTLRYGKCPICDEDEFYEAERDLHEGDDSLPEAMKQTARDAAALDMTPWSENTPALLRRQAD